MRKVLVLSALLLIPATGFFARFSATTGQAEHPTSHQPTSPNDLTAVRKVTKGIIDADNTGDLAAVAILYAEDAIWLPPSGPLVESKKVILARYQTSFAQFKLEYTMRSEETQVFGDWAFDRGFTEGRIIPKDGGAPRHTHDKYIMILHKGSDGGWRISRLMWSPV